MDLPPTLRVEQHGDVAVLRLCRSAKRNALDDATVLGIETCLDALPSEVRCLVLDAEGDHFSAGLDLGELAEADAMTGVRHSRMWHRVFDRIEHGTVPVVAVLKGAVVGGGLELACAAHIRVAEQSAFYALPEGSRGLFVGGGGSVRVPRLIGAHRVVDMMLTGRVLDAAEGQALGLTHYLVESGGLDRAMELARRIATNSPVTTFAVLQALPRIVEGGAEQGYLTEALMAAVASSSAEAQQRMADFVNGRGPKVGR